MANISIHKSFASNILQFFIMFLVMYQTFHLIDHVLQYYQLYISGVFPPPGLFEGLLNASDTKIHLWLNIIEYITIVLIMISFCLTYARVKKVQGGHVNRSYALKILYCTIIFLVIYQTLHVLDHSLQYYQLYVLGISEPPALFEGFFNESDTRIHLWINAILITSSFIILLTFIKSRVILTDYTVK
jgi:fumarate reductase subunit D